MVILTYEKGADKLLDVEHIFANTCLTLLTHAHTITNKCYTFGNIKIVVPTVEKIPLRHFFESKETDEKILT